MYENNVEVKDNLGALDVIPKLTPEIMEEIDEVRLCATLADVWVSNLFGTDRFRVKSVSLCLRVHVHLDRGVGNDVCHGGLLQLVGTKPLWPTEFRAERASFDPRWVARM